MFLLLKSLQRCFRINPKIISQYLSKIFQNNFKLSPTSLIFSKQQRRIVFIRSAILRRKSFETKASPTPAFFWREEGVLGNKNITKKRYLIEHAFFFLNREECPPGQGWIQEFRASQTEYKLPHVFEKGKDLLPFPRLPRKNHSSVSHESY